MRIAIVGCGEVGTTYARALLEAGGPDLVLVDPAPRAVLADLAAEHEGNAAAAEEISQLLYHLQVLMLAKGLSLEDVYRHL